MVLLQHNCQESYLDEENTIDTASDIVPTQATEIDTAESDVPMTPYTHKHQSLSKFMSQKNLFNSWQNDWNNYTVHDIRVQIEHEIPAY